MKKYCHTVRHPSISTLLIFSVLAGGCLTSEDIFFRTTSLNAQKGDLESHFIRAAIVTPQTDALMTSTGARTEKPAGKLNRLNPLAQLPGLPPERFSAPICNRRHQSLVEDRSPFPTRTFLSLGQRAARRRARLNFHRSQEHGSTNLTITCRFAHTFSSPSERGS
jgi:hypothetical protein